MRFDGVDRARPTEQVLVAIDSAELLVIGPSNPIVSVGPILALPGHAGGDPRRRRAWRAAASP